MSEHERILLMLRTYLTIRLSYLFTDFPDLKLVTECQSQRDLKDIPDGPACWVLDGDPLAYM